MYHFFHVILYHIPIFNMRITYQNKRPCRTIVKCHHMATSLCYCTVRGQYVYTITIVYDVHTHANNVSLHDTRYCHKWHIRLAGVCWSIMLLSRYPMLMLMLCYLPSNPNIPLWTLPCFFLFVFSLFSVLFFIVKCFDHSNQYNILFS